MPSSSAPELDLPTIFRALAGDVPALARLYAAYQPLVLRTTERTLERRRLTDPPCDLASEVWVRLLEHGCRALRAFDPARGSFRGFMKMVAWQRADEVARRWQRRAIHEDPCPWAEGVEPPAPCATEALHHRLLVRRMLAALPQLPSIDLTLLEEALLWQTPMRELAPRLGRGVLTLHKRNERLRRRLCAVVMQLDPEPLLAAA